MLNVQGNNGFEVLRLANEKMDKIPEDAQFQLNCSLPDIIKGKDGTVVMMKDARETLEMIHKSDGATVQYQRARGRMPGPHRLKEVLWRVMDQTCKIQAQHMKLNSEASTYIIPGLHCLDH